MLHGAFYFSLIKLFELLLVYTIVYTPLQIVTPLLRCLGNVCSGPDEYCLKACENPRLLHTLGQYLDSSIRHIVKETLWVFSNIAGNQILDNTKTPYIFYA